MEHVIHPTRLYLLAQLIEQGVAGGNIQVVATTHSSQLLGVARPQTLEHAALTYRLEGQPDTRIKRILDIPEAGRLLREQGAARLHASGWFEDIMAFVSDPEVGVEAGA